MSRSEAPVPIVDFARSYVTFFTTPAQGNSIARIQLDAICTLFDAQGEEVDTYYLGAACRSEDMYRDENLFLTPNYEFCGIFSQDYCLLVRTHWTSDRDWHEPGSNTVRFARVAIDTRPLPTPRQLESPAEIVAATLANRPLVATTELRDEATGQRGVLMYPVKTQNVVENPPQFQVDTGPILVPDFASTAPTLIQRFDISHVVYNRLTRAEFIARRPVVVGERDGSPVSVTDYSVITTHPAENHLWCSDAE